MKICPQCGKQYPLESIICQVDGATLSQKANSDPYIGFQLANFTFQKQIGRGGFGVVYLAKHRELGNLVAVKILKKQFVSDEQLVERFRREARVSSQINHENVVQIIDFGFDEELGFYYIMEYLDGHSLSDLMKSYPKGMPLERLLPIMHQICSALEQAHNISVVHRDLKPSNIFLVKRYMHDDVIKILDFGIAKVLQGEEGGGMTVTGQIVGSPRFMSPEQARGRHAEVDARSDIYSLGVILFWTLTGRLPFESKQLARLLYMHVKMPPPQLRAANPQKQYPVALEELVQAALSKRKDGRPSTSAELYRRFEIACQGALPAPTFNEPNDDFLGPDARDRTLRLDNPTSPTPQPMSVSQITSHPSGGILSFPPPASRPLDASHALRPVSLPHHAHHDGPEDPLESTQIDNGQGDVRLEMEAMLSAGNVQENINETVHLHGNKSLLSEQDLTTSPILPPASEESTSLNIPNIPIGASIPSSPSSPSLSSLGHAPPRHSQPPHYSQPSHHSQPPHHPQPPHYSQLPQQPQAQASPKKTFSWKTFLLVLLFVVLMFELAFVGWRLWQKRQPNQSFLQPHLKQNRPKMKRTYHSDSFHQKQFLSCDARKQHWTKHLPHYKHRS